MDRATIDPSAPRRSGKGRERPNANVLAHSVLVGVWETIYVLESPWAGNMTRHNRIRRRTEHPRAIVIGGGIAGMLASRVLADHFDDVLLLERDRYPSGPDPRPGVPQARHVHLLLMRGKRVLEHLFPGLTRELIDHGAQVVAMGHELAVMNYHGWRARYEGGLELLTFTRPLLEWVIRGRLADVSSIRSVQECRVTGLLADQDASKVVGAQIQLSDEPDNQRELHAELIVDASGRFSQAPTWLSSLGYPRPEETVVDPLLGYASRIYEANDAPNSLDALRPGWKAILLMGKPPNLTRAGVLLPVEGNRWHVTLIGVAEDYPPTDERGFITFARSLRSSVILEAISQTRPISPIFGSRATENRRLHYATLPRRPEGFVVLGDALCSLNPIYGQGMSAAALQAMTLDRCLGEQESQSGSTNRVAHRFHARVTEAIETPWLLATGDDFRWPKTKASRGRGLSLRLVHRYLDAVGELATVDPQVDRALTRVAHLIAPARELIRPRIAIRALARMLNPYSKSD